MSCFHGVEVSSIEQHRGGQPVLDPSDDSAHDRSSRETDEPYPLGINST